jgi:hypothetical protein
MSSAAAKSRDLLRRAARSVLGSVKIVCPGGVTLAAALARSMAVSLGLRRAVPDEAESVSEDIVDDVC